MRRFFNHGTGIVFKYSKKFVCYLKPINNKTDRRHPTRRPQNIQMEEIKKATSVSTSQSLKLIYSKQTG